ncbi:MAG: hypothetical protein KatS3mg121_0817 [Gammaproteobacteria bacterium]|nr:MAG: hypothetical protein KatS3mg121_0817 [Gammaproteobacteria bacterium]
MLAKLAAVAAGAALGAVLRYLLGLALNPLFPSVPLGTLAANLLGAYLIGLAIGLFDAAPLLAPHWRLFVITGFLGGLTTFSTFSAEVLHLLQSARPWPAAAAVGAHLGGSLLLAALGLASAAAWRRF